jgi:hypothetical protein
MCLNRWNEMKKLIICLLLLGSFLFSENHERIKIPDNIKIEENGFNEILIKNLSDDEEIYYAIGITIIDENIFIGNAKPVEIVKLNLKGETVQRGGKEGRGPGEFVYCLCPKEVNNKLVFFDIHNKLIFYTTDLKFIKEFKLPIYAGDYIFNNKDEFIFPQNYSARHGKYFGVYTINGKFLRSFGKRKIGFDAKKHNADKAFCMAYDLKKDGLWVAFGNRYDLNYYEHERVKIEICEKKDFFKEFKTKEENSGEIYTDYTGRPLKLEVVKDKLFYFFRKDKQYFCDIFNKNNYTIKKRIKLKNHYRRITYYKNHIFYATCMGSDNKDEVRLYRLELK